MQTTHNVWLYKVKLLYACGIFALLFSSCSYKQNQILFERKTNAIDTVYHGMIQPAPYKIRAQDILQVRNLQNIKYITDEVPTGPSGNAPSTAQGGQMGQTYQVEEDGTVALPVIGRVPVVGLSRFEATKKIEAMYRKSLLKDPIIEVKIINLNVTLLGEVRSPGNYPLVKDRTSLTELIGAAGGLTDKANEKKSKDHSRQRAKPSNNRN
jgi:polysaccharide export outer membrane protein